MAATDGAGDPGNAAEGLSEQLRQLEEFVTRAEAAGDDLPPEAVEMVDRLREIIRALEGLTSSLESPADAPSSNDASATRREEHGL